MGAVIDPNMHKCAHSQTVEVVKDLLSLIFLLQIVDKVNHIFENSFFSVDVEPVCGCYYGQL